MIQEVSRRYRESDSPFGNPVCFTSGLVVVTRFDIWLTRLVIFLFLILEVFQYLSQALSDWRRVKMFCRYIVQEHSWLNNHVLVRHLLFLMCRLKMTRQYWSNTVGQYSLLHACIQSEISCISCLWLPSWMRSFLIRTSITTHRHLSGSV